MPAEEVSLRDELVSAFAEGKKEPDTSPAAREPVAKEPVAKEPAAREPAAREPAAKQAVAKEPAAKEAVAKELPADPLSTFKFIDPPAKWTKAEKEEWEKLKDLAAKNPELADMVTNAQRILAGRNKGMEASFTRQMTELASHRHSFKEMDEVLAPRRDVWRKTGVSDAQAVGYLLQMWDEAQNDLPSFFERVARERGFDLGAYVVKSRPHLSAGGGGQPGQGGDVPFPSDDAMHPAVAKQLEALAAKQQELDQKVGQTTQWAQQQETQRRQSIHSEAARELSEFQSALDDQGQPLYPFFQDVSKDMSVLMGSGRALTLRDAYTKAVRMNDGVWTQIQESQEVTRRREDERKRSAEAERARRAGASVRASSSDFVPSDASGQPMSLRDEITAGFAKYRVGDRI